MAASPVLYRPRFIGWTALLAQLPFSIFISVWAGGFVGSLFKTFLPYAHTVVSWRIGNPFVVIGSTTFVLILFIDLGLKRLNYSSTTYRLYPDRIEIDEGFLTQRRKDIRLSAVREINLRRGILQRIVGLGSVYVATQATGQGPSWSPSAMFGATSTFGSGAMLMDIVAFAEAYDQIRHAVDRAGDPTP
jgi:membrane protein YdbS with pleckstrin-like domain